MNDTATLSTSSFEAVVPEATSHASLPAAYKSNRIPECYVPKATFLLSSPNIMLSMQHHLRASTTSNQELYEILQNIEKELATNRSIMLDIQSRLSLLEQRTGNSPALVKSVTGVQHSQNQRTLRSPERKTWWDVYQSFLDSCDTPHSIHEPVKRPKNFSGFQFDFECSDYKRKTSSAPPDVGDVPDLTPTSERPSSTRPAPPNTSKIDPRHGYTEPNSMPRDNRGQNDIVEHVVAVDRLMIPKPPLLQSPPRSRKSANSLLSLSNDITALPAMPSQPSSPQISQDRRSYMKQVKNRVERSSLKKLFRISRTTAHD
ncbi:hypothetical protein FB567DRAFT_241171 [Paraphoma chrysanthemicola]|uniref:Uncharacterized protein n=1 Tax=Paraphoma chrysanthemicola TaxID=798071 RepID=A0A8K0W2X0_9PLEO|nr:hypothetical protein FB567DRAFT_241171 [Paraphoma chrysanthemicola]